MPLVPPAKQVLEVDLLYKRGVVPPDIHIFTASKQPWVVLPKDVPAVAEYKEQPRFRRDRATQGGCNNMWSVLPRTIRARPAGARPIIISLLALFGTLATQNGRAVPLAVYGGLPSVEDVALSPDGSRIAYVRTEGDLRIVVVATVADRKMIRWVKVSEEKLRSLEWADDDNVMLETSVTTADYGFKHEWFMLRVYNVSRNEVRSLPGNPLGTDDHVLNTVVGEVMVRRVNGHTVLFVPGVYVNQGVALFRCDLTTGNTRVERVGTSETSWLVDSEGQLAAEQDYDKQTHHWLSRGETRLQMLEATVTFLRAHDPPD